MHPGHLKVAPDCAKIIASGVCRADCCGPVPIPKSQMVGLRFAAVRPIEREIDLGADVIPMGKDLHCVFLKKDWTCAIYSHRPEVCRKFGAPGETHPCLQCPHV